jgi:Spy/CpxP family protein refolding chaperone
MRQIAMFLLAATMLVAAPAIAQEAGGTPATAAGTDTTADTNMQILIQKIKADKKLLVASNMDLTDAEGKKFWPLYDAYQKELMQLNQRLAKTIKEYADAYNEGKGTISNETAKKLLHEALSVEEAEVKIKRAAADKIGKVLSATKTARYIQIENKIRAVVKMELAQQIPLVY